jgi:GGDEF domain-containing protein
MTGKPRKVASVVRGELPDGEAVVSLAGGERALILNAVADAVLELCDGRRTIDQIAQFVRDTIAVPPGADVTHDISALVDELSRSGLVEPVE